MEELYEGLTKFVNENPKAFESTKQWLGQFDGDYDAAWEDAQADLTPDWKKIVFVTVKTLENGIEFMLNRILAGEYMTSEHPNLGRIRNALEQGKKELKKELLPPINTAGLWSGSSLGKLREIDSNAKRNGIAGNTKTLKRLKEYLTRRRKRKDIAETLYHEDGRVKTKMAHRSIFKQK